MKRKIAVLFGGHSAEYDVSLQSASAVLENLSPEKYDLYPVGITKYGDWFHYTGRTGNIANGTWEQDKAHSRTVAVSQSRSVKGFGVCSGYSKTHAIRSCTSSFCFFAIAVRIGTADTSGRMPSSNAVRPCLTDCTAFSFPDMPKSARTAVFIKM